MAGKVGSYITSSIGTMRVTEQIDALEVMGINSLNYLVLPKIVALMLFPFVIALPCTWESWVVGWLLYLVDIALGPNSSKVCRLILIPSMSFTLSLKPWSLHFYWPPYHHFMDII